MVFYFKSIWRKLKSVIFILYYALRDPKTPDYIKLLILLIVAYAATPIDIIYDFIPVLGYLDEAIILPVAVYFILKLIPADSLAEYERKSSALRPTRRKKIIGGILVFLFILFLFSVVSYLAYLSST
jgi:uncharacterized membrane protein YkvA (DUF1232 family)